MYYIQVYKLQLYTPLWFIRNEAPSQVGKTNNTHNKHKATKEHTI